MKTLYIPIDTTIYDTVECPKLVKRGDTLRLQIKVFTDGVLRDLTGQNIDIILQKADGTLIENTIDIANISNGVVTAILDVQATVVAGLVSGELQLSDESGQESTNTFTFEVNSSLADGVIEVSKDDINTLNQLRDLIATGEATIAEYETHILAIANSIEAIEALENIESYINTNLPALENENAEAVVNINNLQTKNSEAITNQAALEQAIEEANAFVSAHGDIIDLDNRVTQNTAQLSDMEQQNNLNGVANALRKFKNMENIKVALMGDSLFEGAGGTPYWWQLLFTESYRSSGYSLLQDFNMPVNSVTIDNYAIGGTTPDLMLAHLIPQATSSNGGYTGGCLSDKLYTSPPIPSKNYDLVFIDGGINGGLYTEIMIEEIVRRFIEVGTEVVLVSCQRRTTDTTPPSFQENFHRIAKHYGCVIIDFDDIYYSQYTGNVSSLYADTIHQSTTGHQLWANTIRDIINVNNSTLLLKSTSGILPSKRLYKFNDNDSSYDICFVNKPFYNTGSVVDYSSETNIKNPLVSHGCTQGILLNSGQQAKLGIQNAKYIIPVLARPNNSAKIDYYINDMSTPKGFLNMSFGYTVAWTVCTIPYENFENNNYIDCNLNLNVVNGSVKILGFIVFSEPNYKIKFEQTLAKCIRKTGTWTYAEYYNQYNPESYYTNTLNDYVEIDYVGESIAISLGTSKAGGQIEIKLDGIIQETHETFVSGASQGFRVIKLAKLPYGKHTVKLQYVSLNSSAEANGVAYPARFAIRDCYVFSGKENETEKKYLEKRWNEIASF